MVVVVSCRERSMGLVDPNLAHGPGACHFLAGYGTRERNSSSPWHCGVSRVTKYKT